MELVFVTGNDNKLREVSEILGFEIKSSKIDLPEEQEIEVDKVIEKKAKVAYEKIGKPVIVEDTGLYFEAMNGFPGALVKWVLQSVGNEGIVTMLNGQDRRAYAKTSIAYFDGKDLRIFKGITKGKISEAPRGTTQFGWDTVFIPENHEKTFAEMTNEEKNGISMRKIACEHLRDFLQA